MTMKCCLILLVTFVTLLQGTASATAPFKKAFGAKYVKESGDDEFKAAFRKSSCNACHVKGKKKDWLNPYGLELAKTIPGNVKQRLDDAKKIGKDECNAEKEKVAGELQDAFVQVGKLKSASGISYDETFQSHTLPSAEGAKSVFELADGE
jgi:hypothetical protein